MVVLVWDGMRPDFITPQYTPNLCTLGQGGVFFKNHHPVYLSTTEVNGTALATGVYPSHSGIYANADYRPEISFLGSIATEGLDAIRRGDMSSGGHFLLSPTLAEILQQAGHATATAGTKPVTLLHDRSAKRVTKAQTNSAILFAGQTIPKSALKDLEKANDDKKFPTTNTTPNTEKDGWTTKALTKGLWKHSVPKYSLLWLYDPDSTQHAEGVGSDQALASIANSDKSLEDVLKALEEKKVLDKTDVIVVSDHGFSNIKRGPDVVDAMKKAKLKAVRKFEDPEPGEILVVGHGGSCSFYVVDHDEKVIRKVIDFLQGTDFAGVIFSRVTVEGTFPMEAVHIDTTNVVPDVVISMRWTDEQSETGARGLVMSDGGSKGKGTHGSLSHFDMHNIMVAAGPDFKKGLVNDLPTGNVDLAPTILWILGVPAPRPMDGRVVHEALATSQNPVLTPSTKTLEATRDLGWWTWKQYLKYSQVGTTVYYDEGNGGVNAK